MSAVPRLSDWTCRSLNEPQTALINDFIPNFHQQDTGLGHFSLFSKLPPELRVKIWEFALPRERFLEISLGHPEDQWYFTRGDAPEQHVGMFVARTDRRYRLCLGLKAYRPLALLQVNSEARRATLDIYRIRIPVRPGQHSGVEESVSLHFSPDRDILSVSIDSDASDLLADLLAETILQDPKRKGIKHLAIDLRASSDQLSRLPLRPERIPANTREQFRKALVSLERVFFGHRRRFQVFQQSRLNRSLPLHGAGDVITILPADPRPIGLDLSDIKMRLDEESVMLEWEQMEQNFGVVRPEGSKKPLFQFILTAPPLKRFGRAQIEQRTSFSCPTAYKGKLWDEKLGRDGKLLRDGILNPEAPEELQQVPLTAVGFWIFPIGALECPKETIGTPSDGMNTVLMDLSQYRPQLALLHLR